jgi:shikimate dehydrogenase
MTDRCGAASVLVGLIGAGIEASLTPALHEREAMAQGLSLVYRRIDLTRLGLGADALPELLRAAERLGFDGLNITHPCKQSVIPLLDELSEEARLLGAVNTVVLRGGRRIGHNTDGAGFAESFRRGLADAPRRRIVLLGAGGAGAAVAHALLAEGAGEIAIVDPDAARAQALAERLAARFGATAASLGTDPAAATRQADGIVNCSPVGMAKLPGLPIAESLLHPGLWVADVVYVPIETELLRAARARGCRTLDGGGMAVFQAAGAFRLFTGLMPDAERMRRHFAAMLAEAPALRTD